MTAAEIAKLLKARPSGKGWRCRCPSHTDKHPSLWFSDAVTVKNPSGILRFQCKAGCDHRQIRAAIGILSEGKPFTSTDPRRINSASVDDDPLGQIVRRRKIRQLWDRSIPIVQGSPAWIYLVEYRQVLPSYAPIPAVMREVPDLAYYSSNDDGECVHAGDFPAIVTRMDDVNGKLVTLHRTYLMPDGIGKLDVDKPKKLMQSPVDGCTDGAAIHLFDPCIDPAILEGESDRVILGVTEGIESALAVNTLFGAPVWAAWCASGLAKIHIPTSITDLIIFGDNDPPGIKAINELIEWLKEESPALRVVIKLPPTPGADWADEILNSK